MDWESERIGQVKPLTPAQLLHVAKTGGIRDPRMEVAVHRLCEAIRTGKISLKAGQRRK